jgi:hypothetical protein
MQLDLVVCLDDQQPALTPYGREYPQVTTDGELTVNTEVITHQQHQLTF